MKILVGIALIVFVAGCGSNGGVPDMAPDAARFGDQAVMGDLALAADLATAGDLAIAPDLAMAPDLAAPMDFAVPNDLSPPLDFAVVDLATPIDLSTPLDLRMPDLIVPPDQASPSCNPKLALFGPPAKGDLGGQHVFDSQGYLYIPTYRGGVLRVPPGGGPIEVLVTPDSLVLSGFLGAVYVEKGDLVVFAGRKKMYRYDVARKTLTGFGTIPDESYGFGVVEDGAGNIIAMVARVVLKSDGTLLGAIHWNTVDLVLSDAGIFQKKDQENVERRCFGGDLAMAVGTGATDEYGMAFGGDGAIYMGQGNTNPSKVWRIPPGGGVATSLTTVPMSVTSVESDPSGAAIYLGGFGDGNTIWKIDLAKGTKVVYGCDPMSKRKCGDTM